MRSFRFITIIIGLISIGVAAFYYYVMDQYFYSVYDITNAQYILMNSPFIFCSLFGFYLIFLHDDSDSHPID